jgi:hypothetical protein
VARREVTVKQAPAAPAAGASSRAGLPPLPADLYQLAAKRAARSPQDQAEPKERALVTVKDQTMRGGRV